MKLKLADQILFDIDQLRVSDMYEYVRSTKRL
jgi:hypothetical protein